MKHVFVEGLGATAQGIVEPWQCPTHAEVLQGLPLRFLRALGCRVQGLGP